MTILASRGRGVAGAAIILAGLSGSLAAQSDSAVAANYRRDSIQYVRDSTSIDSLSRLVPVDSLRRLYELMYRATDPRPLAQEVACESDRLWIAFGVAARIAEQRVHDAVMRRLDRDAELRLSEKMAGTLVELDGPRCGAATRMRADVPARLRQSPHAPRRSRSARERAVVRDSLRRAGKIEFEATITGSRSAELAGTARLRWWTPEMVGMTLHDWLHYPPSIIAVTFARSGGQYFRAGSYPLVRFQDKDPGSPGFVGAYVQIDAHTIGTSPRDFVSGVLFVDRADTLGAEGHFEVTLMGNVLRSRTYRPVKGEITDTLEIRGQFRARFENQWVAPNVDKRWWPDGHPAPIGPTPEYRATLARVDLDERVSCDSLSRLVNGNPFVRFAATDPILGRHPLGTVRLQFEADSLGRVPPTSVLVMSSSDTSLESLVVLDSTRRAKPGWSKIVYRPYRCTLHLGDR